MTRLWRASAPLTLVGCVMLAVLAGSLVGLWLDPRTITGAPAWLKPTKFAISIAIYTLTLAWIFTYLPAWPRLRRFVGRSTAAVFVLEMVIIDVQAWRGAASHFNIATPLDAALFTTMGMAILAQTLLSIAVAVALWRQPFADRALGWAFRLGLTISIVAAALGGLMTTPTSAQLEEVRATGRMPLAGAHTVGAPDGGRGLPVTGWSLEHGDLRAPHFLGLHALQVLPFIALVFVRRSWHEAKRVSVTIAAAASYALLFAILLWQALRGQSVVHPDLTMFLALGGWVALTVAIVWIAAARTNPLNMHAVPS